MPLSPPKKHYVFDVLLGSILIGHSSDKTMKDKVWLWIYFSIDLDG